MKAFTLYPSDRRNLNVLLDNLRKYGECNCDFNTFINIYNEWHIRNFPGRPINTGTINMRSDWLNDFINFIANYELPEVKRI